MIYIIALIIMLAFTLLAFRRNAVVMLSISFTIIYLIEIALYYISPSQFLDFIITLGAKYPPDIGIYSSIYIHSLSPLHIFFNILFFFLAGMPFESRVGSKRLTTIFLVSGMVANVIYSLFLHLYGINSLLIGASGAIFGVMGAFVVMYPNDEITMFLGPILMPKIKVKIAIMALLVVEFLATMLWVNDNVAHGAHVVGAITGAFMGYYYLKRGVVVKKEKMQINEKVFEELATNEKLKKIEERIKKEEDLQIRNVWIEEFFKKKFGDAKIDGKFINSGGKRYRIYR